MNSKKNKKWIIAALVCNLAVVIMEIIGAVMSWIQFGFGMFAFYTQDSNFFAFFGCLVIAIFQIQMLTGKISRIPTWVQRTKYMCTCCLTVTFVVVCTVLIPLSKSPNAAVSMLFQGTMLYHHFLCPILAFVSFLFFERGSDLDKNAPKIAMLPTILYAIVLLILNIAKLYTGPYPFLHVYEQPLWMSCIWFVIIVGGAYVFALLIHKINTRNTTK